MSTVNELKPTQWLAERLGVSISTIERWRARGENNLPPHIQLGGVIRYDEKEVEAWIKTKSMPATATTPVCNKECQNDCKNKQ